MIRLKGLDQKIINSLLSGLFSGKTLTQHYVYLHDLLSILPVEETSQVYYCIFSALECLQEIYSIRRTIPAISKEVILQIVGNNLYGELKENNKVGFREYARLECGVELDPLDTKSLTVVYQRIIQECDINLTEAVSMNLTVEDSFSKLPEFISNYSEVFATELSELITLYNINDSKIVKYQFWGWSDFLYRHKIYSILDLSKLLRLAAAHIDNKTYLISHTTAPLTSISQLITLEQTYIDTSIPLGSWGIPPLDDLVKLVPHEVSIIVGEKGLGKTTLAGYLTGTLIAQGKKVLFYCPEILKHKLILSFVLPAYIKAKYHFIVTPDQCLGLEPPYEFGSDLTQDEKVAAIQMAKLEFAESGLFYHSDVTYNYKTLKDDIRSKLIEFEPDIVIFDHTLEVDGEADYNKVTAALADAFKDVKKEFPIHIIALSHAGSEFTVPTKNKPIVTSKIVAWSKRMEGAADNLIGAFPSQGDIVNLFFTKLRWNKIPPMYLVFRMDRIHVWFEYRIEDQFSNQITHQQIEALTQMSSYKDLLLDDDGDDDDDNDDEFFLM